MRRKHTQPVFIGGVQVGGGAPVVVQSMTNTDTRDVRKTVRQVRRLARAGCEIVRVAVPDEEAAQALRAIRKAGRLPLIADIHFQHGLALAAIHQGVDAIRINPGNLARDKIRRIAKAAGEAGIPIRIGINAGSLEKDLLSKHGGPHASALVESALRHIDVLRQAGFDAIKVSLKSSDVLTTLAAYREMSARSDCPLHLGVTEAGTEVQAAVKSSLGIGMLLAEGIGDTIRVSATGDPVREMPIAYGILRALGIRRRGVEIISCPTCGRCEIDLMTLSTRMEKALAGCTTPLKVALMGCVVNGPGEAAEADVGIAGGRGFGFLFRKGKVIRKVPEAEFVAALLTESEALASRGCA
jgi:(E)-4-hydroxy-3-methylbut-2-enyl-diphosphate synthase